MSTQGALAWHEQITDQVDGVVLERMVCAPPVSTSCPCMRATNWIGVPAGTLLKVIVNLSPSRTGLLEGKMLTAPAIGAAVGAGGAAVGAGVAGLGVAGAAVAGRVVAGGAVGGEVGVAVGSGVGLGVTAATGDGSGVGVADGVTVTAETGVGVTGGGADLSSPGAGTCTTTGRIALIAASSTTSSATSMAAAPTAAFRCLLLTVPV